MIDPDLTAVLRRRCMAFAIDFGLVSLLTALVARSQFEGFPIDPEAWTPDQFDRLVTLKDDRFHRMQELGDTQHVISGGGILLTAAVGLVLATILFILLPAITGWSPGKKLVGLRVVGTDGSTPSLGQLITRSVALVADLFPFVLPGLLGLVQAVPSKHHQRLGDRLARTAVVDAAKVASLHGTNLDVGERLRTGEAPIEPTGLPAPDATAPAPQTAAPQTAAPQTVPPPDRTPVTETGAHPSPVSTPTGSTPTAPTPTAPTPTEPNAPDPLRTPVTQQPTREKIDASEFLDAEPGQSQLAGSNPALAGPPSAEDLVEATDNPGQRIEPMLFDEPLEGESFALEDVGMSQSKVAKPMPETPASLAGPPLAGLSGADLPTTTPSGGSEDGRNIDFDLDPEPGTAPEPSLEVDPVQGRDSVFSASTKPKQEAPEQEGSSKDAHPPPAHRREQPRPAAAPAPEASSQWDAPRAEPAPVWRPDETLDGTSPAAETPTERGSVDDAATASAPTDNQLAQTATDSKSTEPVDPVWSDDWQAWLYWDAKRRRWLRHDIDTDQWISIS